MVAKPNGVYTCLLHYDTSFTVTDPADMDGFGSDFSAGGSSGKVDTGTIMEQVKVQIAVANAQELLQVNQ